MNPIRLAYQTAYQQGGVISREQLLSLGIDRGTIYRKTESQQWARVHRAIYELISMGDVDSRLRAAVAMLPTAVASHESAAEIHGIDFLGVEKGKIVVSVMSETTHFHIDATVHRNSDLLPEHIEEIAGLEVTTRIRTLFDLCMFLGKYQAFALLDQQRILKHITLSDITTITSDIARRGKPGSTLFRQYCEERNAQDSASVLHQMGMALISDSELPPPHEEYPIPWDPRSRFDAAYPEEKIAIEFDGYRYHSEPGQFQQDRQRDRTAQLHGWIVLRFTWSDIAYERASSRKTIETHLARRKKGTHA